MFNEAKDDGGGGDNWSYKSCKAPVKSSPPTNQIQFYRPDALPVASGGSRGGRLGQLPRAPREGAPKRESKNNANLHDEKRD